MKELFIDKYKRHFNNNRHIKIIKTTLGIISKTSMRAAIYLLLISAVIEVLTSGAINNIIVEDTKIIEWCYSFTMSILSMLLVIVGFIIMLFGGNFIIC